MGAWTWKLATAASCATTLAVVAWNVTDPPDPHPALPEPIVPSCTAAAQAPAALMRAYPHLADAIQADPIGALVTELHAARGASRACKLMDALGRLGGDQATAALGEVLQSKRPPSVRQCAAWELASISSASSTSWLSEVVRDPDPSVRSAAIHALASRDDPFARQTVIELTHDDDERVHREALLALVEAGVPEATDIIIADLPQADATTQVAYVRALREGKATAGVPALEQLATQGHQTVRATAIEAWAALAGDAATEKLSALLYEGPENARRAALEALGEIASDGARAALLSAVRGNDADLGKEALHVLGRMDGDEIHALMLEEIESSEPGRVEVALGYFVERGDTSSVPRLAALAREGTQELRTRAVRGLGRLGGEEARETLLGLARSPGPMRQEVLRSLADAGVPATQRCELLEHIVREDSADSRYALDMLTREGGPTPTRVMADVLERGGALAGHAAHTLARSGDERSLAALARAARSSTHATRLAALRYLGESGNASAAPLLRAALDDADSQVRYTAFQGMFALGGRHTESAGLKLLQSDGEDDKKRALEALGKVRSPAARAALLQAARDEQLGATALSTLAELEPKRAASLAREAMSSGSPARQEHALAVVHSVDQRTASSIVEEALRSREPGTLRNALQASRAVRTPVVEQELIAILQDKTVDHWLRRQAAYQLRAWGGATAQRLKDSLDEALGVPRP